jgi:hypothetical protein
LALGRPRSEAGSHDLLHRLVGGRLGAERHLPERLYQYTAFGEVPHGLDLDSMEDVFQREK